MFCVNGSQRTLNSVSGMEGDLEFCCVSVKFNQFAFSFKPVMPNGISRLYHLDESISNLRVVG